jgi:DNA adenine methylase
MGKVKSPLRYPGGKSRLSEYLVSLFPNDFDEYREPFVGGGSVFFTAKQWFHNKKFRINDLFQDLYIFWKMLRDYPDGVVENVRKLKYSFLEGRRLYDFLTSPHLSSEIEKAAEFFTINRITFSGTTLSGGYSNESFQKRFTDSSIDRLEKSSEILSNDVEITGNDFSHLTDLPGNKVFLFLDPPYFLGKRSKLYGKDGNLHRDFEHERLFESLRNTPHRWLMTYNDCDQIREMYSDFNIKPIEFAYGMQQGKTGKEIIISNYAL